MTREQNLKEIKQHARWDIIVIGGVGEALFGKPGCVTAHLYPLVDTSDGRLRRSKSTFAKFGTGI